MLMVHAFYAPMILNYAFFFFFLALLVQYVDGSE